MSSLTLEEAKDSGSLHGRELFPTLLIGCAIAISVIIVSQLAVVLWLGWVDGSPGVGGLSYTWKNYAAVFSDGQTLNVIATTCAFSIISLVVACAFGIPIAWIVERTDFRGKTLLFTLMTIATIIPGFAGAMGWLFLMHPRIGLVNVWLMRTLDLHDPPFDITTVGGMGWVQGLSLAPVAFIMTAAVIRAMDPTLEEAAQMSGASVVTTTRRVTLPLAWPGILAASIYIFTIGFAAFDVPAIIGWSNRIFTFSTYIYLLIDPQDVLPRYGAAAALGSLVMALAAVLTAFYGAMQKRSRRYAVITGKSYRPRLVELGRAKYAAWAFFALYILVSKLAPLLLLGWSSLLPFFQLPSARAVTVLSFDHFVSQPWDLVFLGARNTIILMVLTPTLALGFALAISWVVLRSRLRWRGAFDFVAFLPHAVPSVIFAVGALLSTLFVLQKAVPIYGTIWLILLVYTIVQISYATRMTNSGLLQIDAELEVSAQTSGATQAQTFRRVLAPLLSPTLVYAWLWIALLVFRELTLAVVLTTGRNITLPVVIWSLWLGGGLGQASALALIMLAAMTPIIVIYWFVARRQGLLGRS
jgi:iron(III) transport system permease protein